MRRVVLLRHGPAEDAGFGIKDSERALTEKGRRKTERAARGLGVLLDKVDLLAASPYVRAQQTADIAQAQLHPGRRIELDCLTPERHPQEALVWLAEQQAESIVLVGHEPHLGLLAGLALAGAPQRMTVFRKAGAALIEFQGQPMAGQGLLQWLLSPKQLARQADGAGQ